MGTAGATIVTVLINGVAIAQSVLSRPKEGEGEKEETRYTLDIRTENQRTKVGTDGQDTLWIYGKVLCDKPAVDTLALTQGIQFAAEGSNQDWLQIGPAVMKDGFKAAPLQARPPQEGAVLAEGETSVLVSATVEGKLITGPIPIELEGDYDFEFV